MAGRDISSQIRELRIKSGLSLAELARRINSSAATLSRYEKGWDRFELATIRKIADALGCRLDIQLAPTAPRRSSTSGAAANARLKRLFWDHKLANSDIRRHPVWVTERVIEYGSLRDVRTLIDLFGKRAFLRHVASCRFGSAKTASFWNAILNKEGVKCTKRSFPRGASRS